MSYYTKEDLRALRSCAIRWKFSMPSTFKKASYDKLARTCNGIGAEWMPVFARKLTTRLMLQIEASACVHDWDYEYLPATVWNFMVANMRLFYNACKSHAPFSGFVAMIVCSVFGWYAFKVGKKEASVHHE